MKRIILTVILVFSLMIGVGCNMFNRGFDTNVEDFRKDTNPRVVIEMENGKKMYLELFPEQAPPVPPYRRAA